MDITGISMLNAVLHLFLMMSRSLDLDFLAVIAMLILAIQTMATPISNPSIKFIAGKGKSMSFCIQSLIIHFFKTQTYG